jgi:hypothetical protein
MEGEYAEHHPEIKANRQEFSCFIKNPLFEVAFALMQRTLTGDAGGTIGL